MVEAAVVEKVEIDVEVMPDPDGQSLSFRVIVNKDTHRGVILSHNVLDAIIAARRSKTTGKNVPQSIKQWGSSLSYPWKDGIAFFVMNVPCGDAAKFYIWLHSLGGVPAKCCPQRNNEKIKKGR